MVRGLFSSNNIGEGLLSLKDMDAISALAEPVRPRCLTETECVEAVATFGRLIVLSLLP